MCLAGLPLLVSTVTTSWLRAEGRVHTDAATSLIVCVTALGGLFIGTRLGSLQAAVVGLVIGQTIGAIFNAIRVLPLPSRRKAEHALLKEQLA